MSFSLSSIDALRNLGVSAKLRKFIQNLVSEREVFFVTDGKLSDLWVIHKGIPQISILSPILFNIYLADIVDYIRNDSQMLQYANDVAIFALTLISRGLSNQFKRFPTDLSMRKGS